MDPVTIAALIAQLAQLAVKLHSEGGRSATKSEIAALDLEFLRADADIDADIKRRGG